jgi:hypothetical protein
MSALLFLFLLVGCREELSSRAPAPATNPKDAYEDLLNRVVTRDGYVHYTRLQKNRKPLDKYVAWLHSTKAWRGARPTERHADWLNTYNALVLFQVLERGIPESVTQVTGWFGGPGARFFSGTHFRVGPEKMSLNEIKHERIRMSELDFRSHAAMTDATASSPPMQRQLYNKFNLPRQLRAQFGRWVDDTERGIRIEEGRALFNPIFETYARDFEFMSAGTDLCTLAARYASGKRVAQLEALAEQGCPHGYFTYDWSLNSPR